MEPEAFIEALPAPARVPAQQPSSAEAGRERLSGEAGRQRRYPGGRAFEERDEAFFFGRDDASEALLLRVLSVRLLLQFAPSGVGKTSLLNAGLFPRLRDRHFFPFVVRFNQRSEGVLEAVRRSLRDATQGRALGRAIVPAAASSLWELLAGVQLWSRELMLLTPVLVLDQFEEVFTLHDESFRRSFAKQMGQLMFNASAPQQLPNGAPVAEFKVIISLREEYLGKLETFSADILDLFQERMRLAPLSPDEARTAIVSPARLDGADWYSPQFELEPTCLDTLIDFVDGATDSASVIESLTLQLVCRRAEAIARQQFERGIAHPVLSLADFGDLPGLRQLVQNHFGAELATLGSRRAQLRARRLFEHGLLDPAGKRLMLEEGEVERRFAVDCTTLELLVSRGLLRREPRNESTFYEISHDRLAEAIARNRKPQLPRWVLPAIGVSLTLVVLIGAFALRLNRAKQQADQARSDAERALGILLGDELTSRLREVGLDEAIKHVLDAADIDGKVPSEALVSSLSHQSNIARQRGTVEEVRALSERTLRVVDQLAARPGANAHSLTAARATALESLGASSEDRGEVSAALSYYRRAIENWERVLPQATSSDEVLRSVETRLLLGGLLNRLGDSEAAEATLGSALEAALQVLGDERQEVETGRAEGYFALGRAMFIYADAALALATIWTEKDSTQGALALARESLRLRPFSACAHLQLAIASAYHGNAAYGADETGRALELYRLAREQLDRLIQIDPANRRMWRERAAVQLLVAHGTADCSRKADCRASLEPEELDDAEIATLNAISDLQRLVVADPGNRALQVDVVWGRRVQAGIAAARGKNQLALRLLDQAEQEYRRLWVDARDIQTLGTILDVARDKASVLEQAGELEQALIVLEAAAGGARDASEHESIQISELTILEDKHRLLQKLGRRDEGESLRYALNARWRRTQPWARRRERAAALQEQADQLYERASHDPQEGVDELLAARVKYREAILQNPFDIVLWSDHRKANELISARTREAEAASAAGKPTQHEAALREAVTDAWMERLLCAGERCGPTAYKNLYEARRSLAFYLDDRQRARDALPLVEQGVLDATEYARQQPRSAEALFLLADANAGLGLLRAKTESPGWEEALRTALAYGDKLMAREPRSVERAQWVGDWRAELARRLLADRRPESAGEISKLGADNCRSALQLAKRDAAEERASAESCLDSFAAIDSEVASTKRTR